jgi:hypothetical protein
MSSRIEVRDITKDVDLPIEGPKHRGNAHTQYQIESYGKAELDGITFSFIRSRVGDRSYIGEGADFKEGGKEFHVFAAEEKNGIVLAVNVISDANDVGDMRTAHLQSYSVVRGRVSKVVDGVYRGKRQKFASFDEMIESIKGGGTRTVQVERVK